MDHYYILLNLLKSINVKNFLMIHIVNVLMFRFQFLIINLILQKDMVYIQ
jgi:hypothetical protein